MPSTITKEPDRNFDDFIYELDEDSFYNATGHLPEFFSAWVIEILAKNWNDEAQIGRMVKALCEKELTEHWNTRPVDAD